MKIQGAVPRRGDVFWMNFDPQEGHEQAGRRPGVVISPDYYNARSKLLIVCPITSRVKGYPFEVLIPAGLKVSGAIISDQCRSLDLVARQAEMLCAIPTRTVNEVLELVATLMCPV